MSNKNVARMWARKYRRLGPKERQLVNERTNEIFRERTKVLRKLDPRRDKKLCRQWIQFRDEVMEKRSQPGFRGDGFLGLPSVEQARTAVGRGVDMAEEIIDVMTRSADTPWIDVACGELRRGVAVKKGKEAHPRIMMYARTCPHLFEKAYQRDYMESRGDEGFKWCSAFVNWCLQEVGIVGTRRATALSWLNWGKPISKPEHGAIVILQTSSWNHVAFVQDMGSQYKMLGGNQKPEHGKGPQCVSYQRIIPGQVVGYRVPK